MKQCPTHGAPPLERKQSSLTMAQGNCLSEKTVTVLFGTCIANMKIVCCGLMLSAYDRNGPGAGLHDNEACASSI
jgi:hypothetical protein